MSIVKIKFHDENIYQADSQYDKVVEPPKPKMWVKLWELHTWCFMNIFFQVPFKIRKID